MRNKAAWLRAAAGLAAATLVLTACSQKENTGSSGNEGGDNAKPSSGWEETQVPEIKPGKLVERAARNRGLIFRCATEYVAFAPPLVSTPADIDEMCDILDQSLAEVQEMLPTR